jgi:hypothetical protein
MAQMYSILLLGTTEARGCVCVDVGVSLMAFDGYGDSCVYVMVTLYVTQR